MAKSRYLRQEAPLTEKWLSGRSCIQIEFEFGPCCVCTLDRGTENRSKKRKARYSPAELLVYFLVLAF